MRLPYIVLTGLYCAGIFYMSSKQDPVPTDYDFAGLDKLAHVAVYGGLAALVSVGMRRQVRTAAVLKQALVPVLFALCYGMTDEFHQWFIPHRNFDPLDLVANTAGAVIAQVVLFRWWDIPPWRTKAPQETADKLPG